jgi:F0F1-type ATP synthase membrane subunit b/b'
MPFFLIIIGIVLIVINIKALKKEDNSFENILKNKEEKIENYEIDIAKLRREFSETLTELQREIYDLKAELKNLKSERCDKESYSSYEDYSEDILTDDTKEKKIEVSKQNRQEKNNDSQLLADKVNNVHKLMEAGLNDEEICEKLGIGKGEVLLIKGLYNS